MNSMCLVIHHSSLNFITFCLGVGACLPLSQHLTKTLCKFTLRKFVQRLKERVARRVAVIKVEENEEEINTIFATRSGFT